MSDEYKVTIEGKCFKLTNLNKLFWPDDGITKADLVNYFVSVSEYMIPHLRDRPLVLTRYPDGILGNFFYQKRRPGYAPSWLRSAEHEGKTREGPVRYCLADDAASLAWFANMGAIEIHPWYSRVGTLEYPDYVVFDLDPAPPAGFEEARKVARKLKAALEMMGLRGYPKTSGATGIHVYVPIEPVYDYEATRSFAEGVARALKAAYEDEITVERQVEKRTGKVYIDYLQNVEGKTLVSVYCPRPLPGAPVSAPFEWEELNWITPEDFNLRTMMDRLRETGDIFKKSLSDKQRLPFIHESVSLRGRRSHDAAVFLEKASADMGAGGGDQLPAPD